MPSGVAVSTHSDTEWEPRDKDVKRYIHFDRDLSKQALAAIANDPKRVAYHAFFPMLRFHEEWTKYRKQNQRKKKVRPLRYAARIDAAIYARYRALLTSHYEQELSKRNIGDVPVAYRRLPKDGGGNKCNIEIARDVFSHIRDMGDCTVTVVDIKSYFESLDHARIKLVWERLLGQPLPPDHTAVFKSLTKYSIVDLDKLFQRLKLNDPDSPSSGTRSQRRMRKIDVLKANRYKQICSTKEFREIVLGADGSAPSLLQKNGFDFGIPQGTPISDLVANFYLLDFDEEMKVWVSARGGICRRYSDDIVVVLPRSENPMEAKSFFSVQLSSTVGS
ncbi:hypothetical protein M0654_02105 [Rhizobium sp. NTR19]|uniref:Reverse transcriptase domain-containing protein n=1 Tax=Neorhizobium turbinariae TaxID=2937795 RepID=A0ABT0ILQ9_9HYPH|nr:hypothetical protein [Neorhizobium turbinariae]MCK8778766.1 hypothetical protein [Neorhizobium turbinariae]